MARPAGLEPASASITFVLVRSEGGYGRIILVVVTGIEPVPFFLMRETHRPSMLDHYSSYSSATVVSTTSILTLSE